MFASELALTNTSNSNQINIFVLIGSILYTLAGFIQLTESGEMNYLSWKSYLSHSIVVVQFLGMILFDASAVFQMTDATSWVATWLPNFLGCIMFLISAYLFTVELHDKMKWLPNLNWHSFTTVMNVWGCICFISSSVLALPLFADFQYSSSMSMIFGLLGAILFIVGSVYFFICENEKQISTLCQLPFYYFNLILKGKLMVLLTSMSVQLNDLKDIRLQEEHNY